jgi:hypothetical protein
MPQRMMKKERKSFLIIHLLYYDILEKCGQV